jgi:hypothetical protein
MPVRKKRSVSIPADLDTSIADAAKAAGMSYSGWLTAIARQELTLRAGLAAVAAYERNEGAFTSQETAEAEAWARAALDRAGRTGGKTRRSA